MRYEQASFTIGQREDDAGRTAHDTQEMLIEWVDAGGGLYAVIKTDRWAIGGTDAELSEFVEMLKKQRAFLEVPAA